MLAALLCLMLVALTVPLRQFLAQRSQLTTLRNRQAAQARRITALESLVERHHDPAYVEQLARARLHFARPGEVPFIVLTPAPKPTVKKGETPPVAANQPWYGALWQSVQDAGRAAPAASPAAK